MAGELQPILFDLDSNDGPLVAEVYVTPNRADLPEEVRHRSAPSKCGLAYMAISERAEAAPDRDRRPEPTAPSSGESPS